MGLRIWRMARAGGAELNPANYISRATSFSSAAGLLGDVTLLVHRTAAGITGHLVTEDRAGCEAAALHLAQAVAARAEPVEQIPDMSSARTIGWLTYRPGSSANRETQTGVDPSEAARRLAVALAPGQWVAVSLRQPTQGEKRRHRRWLVARMATANPTHHSVTTGAVVVAVRAGGDSPAEVSSLLAQVASAMPGFDVDTVTRTSHPVRAVLAWVLPGLGAWAGQTYGLGLNTWGLAAGSVLTGVGLLLALGVLPVRGSRLVAEVASGPDAFSTNVTVTSSQTARPSAASPHLRELSRRNAYPLARHESPTQARTLKPMDQARSHAVLRAPFRAPRPKEEATCGRRCWFPTWRSLTFTHGTACHSATPD